MLEAFAEMIEVQEEYQPRIYFLRSGVYGGTLRPGDCGV